MNKTYIGMTLAIILISLALYNIPSSTDIYSLEKKQKNNSVISLRKESSETLLVNTNIEDKTKRLSKHQNSSEITIENNLSMASVSTRQNYYNFMSFQEPLLILRTLNLWISTEETKDKVTLELTRKALINQLHFSEDTKEALKLLETLIRDDNKNINERLFFTSILGPVATEESTEILLGLSLSLDNPRLIHAILTGIRAAGDQRWDGEYQASISAPLEKAWHSTERKGQYFAIASGISKAGTSAGTRLLITGLLDSQLTYDELKISKDEKISAAFRSLKDFRNPEAIPVLASMLDGKEYKNNEAAFLLAGNSLAEMGKAKSTEELLSWAVKAPSNKAIWAKKWFAKVRDPSSLKLMKESIDGFSFSSNRIKDEVIRAYRRKSG